MEQHQEATCNVTKVTRQLPNGMHEFIACANAGEWVVEYEEGGTRYKTDTGNWVDTTELMVFVMCDYHREEFVYEAETNGNIIWYYEKEL